MRLASSTYSIEFLATLPNGSTQWCTHMQTDTEAWAYAWVDRLRVEYPTKTWRWILRLADTDYLTVGAPKL